MCVCVVKIKVLNYFLLVCSSNSSLSFPLSECAQQQNTAHTKHITAPLNKPNPTYCLGVGFLMFFFLPKSGARDTHLVCRKERVFPFLLVCCEAQMERGWVTHLSLETHPNTLTHICTHKHTHAQHIHHIHIHTHT